MNYKYLDGRFFISPLVGCKSNCIYCYLPNELANSKIIRKNNYSVEKLLNNIKNDKRFKVGKNGSIISIGAYCDIFPVGDNNLISFSIEWIIKSLKMGNPVQIISKNVLSRDLVKLICKNIKYPKQLLYSTTITSFKYWSVLEVNTSKPNDRLGTLRLFKDEGVPTNVMIKPFLPGVTDYDIKEFSSSLMKDIVDYYVVGELYVVNDKFLKVLNSLSMDDIGQVKSDVLRSEILDCTENKEFGVLADNRMEQFIDMLRENNINIFKKSSCVNSNILGINNISRHYRDFLNRYCVNCGNCSS